MTTTRDSASPIAAADEELIDTLIAISVVAKRLAAKLRQSNENPKESEDSKDEQEKGSITGNKHSYRER